MKRWAAIVSACSALLGCTSQYAVAQTTRLDKKHAIQIDDMTLYVQAPSLLKPSKDFPPPHIANSISLNEVTSPRSLFGGHWDGPRYKAISVAGTLQIVLSIDPWPQGAEGLSSCERKARAIPEKILSRRMERYKQGRIPIAPEMKFEQLKLAGQVAYRYEFPLDSPSGESFIIPLGNQHFIHLTFSSADNSPFNGGWPELAMKAKTEFLNSLELVGNVPKCD